MITLGAHSTTNLPTTTGRSRLARSACLLLLALVSSAISAQEWTYPYPPSLSIRDGYKVLHLKGSPEDLGYQHATLAGDLVQRVLDDVILNDAAQDPDARRELFAGAMVMERYLPELYRRELRALAEHAHVDYEALVALQLFGDVQRNQYCSSYAVYGPATTTGELIAGRNFDYWDNGASKYGALLIAYYPDEGIPFVTVSWAGIINGWTLINACGLTVSNNTCYSGKNSLEGISTCFMLRKIAQFAHNVEEGVEIIKNTLRACGTVILIAGGNPPNAAAVEFDHEEVAVRWGKDGWVAATNEFRTLYKDAANDNQPIAPEVADAPADLPADKAQADYQIAYEYVWECSRYRTLKNLIRDNYGKIDRTMNFVAAPGVGMGHINLHSALLFPRDLILEVSMGETPATAHRYRPFRFTPQGLHPLAEVDGN
jgi:hypothetical protein